MAIIYEPVPWWSALALWCAIFGTLVLLARGAVDRWRSLANPWPVRVSVLLLSLVALWSLAWGARGPRPFHTAAQTSFHLALAVDTSDSIRRAPEGMNAVLRKAANRLEALIDDVPTPVREHVTVSLSTFGDGSLLVEQSLPLRAAPDALRRLTSSDFAAGSKTRIDEGLDRAGRLAVRDSGRGSIMVFSDGHQTDGDALAAAAHWLDQGLAVHVMPVQGGGPELSITAANVPPRVNARATTWVRGTLYNGRRDNVNAELLVERAALPGEAADENGRLVQRQNVAIPAETWRGLRLPLRFRGQGLQYVQLTLRSEDGRSEHQRRFFTQVRRPLRYLSIGGDRRWQAAISADVAEVVHIEPEEMDHINFTEYDTVVLGAVTADRFSDQALHRLAFAIDAYGLGLFLINGDHRSGGLDPQRKTVLMSYRDTPLDPLLPLDPEPRPFVPEPPPRQVVVLIDASGSMGGWRMQISKEIGAYVIGNLLRPQDRLHLLSFSTSARHMVRGELMTDGNKRNALRLLEGITAGGGTDPTAGLEMIANSVMNNCGMLLISDGQFARVNFRPDCRAAVFAIGQASVPTSSALRDFADPFPVVKGFDPAVIKMPFFEHKPRDKFFEPGSFPPLSTERFAAERTQLPVPDIRLDGSAVTSPRKGAHVPIVRPKLTDPVLAYRQAGAGTVAVFGSAWPDSWLQRAEGRTAIAEWISRTVAFEARDRYAFDLEEMAGEWLLTVSLVAKGGRLPQPDRLDVRLRLADGRSMDLAMQRDPVVPGTYRGPLRLTLADTPQLAALIVSEAGVEGTARPQRVPLVLPPQGPVSTPLLGEAFSAGLNDDFLLALAQAGDGQYRPRDGRALFIAASEGRRGKPLWPWSVGFAGVCLVLAVGLRRVFR